MAHDAHDAHPHTLTSDPSPLHLLATTASAQGEPGHYMRTGWVDDCEQLLSPALIAHIIAAIDNWLANDRRVLIHCEHGVSRSAAMTIAYLAA
jgi:protein-tyrosine phosphatase